MKLIKATVISLLLFLLFDRILTKEKFMALQDRCDGICNKDFCTISMRCRPLNRTSKMRSLNVTLHDGIILNAPLIIDIIAYKKFRTQYRPFMVKVKGEFCHEIAEKSHPFFQLFGNSLDEGTLFDPCPLQGFRYLKPIPTSSLVFIPIPTGEWKLEITTSKVFNGTETHILSVFLYYTIKALTAEEF